MSSTTESTSRRKYKRRTDEERIADLEAKIADLKAREDAKKRKDDPLIREIPKIQRRLRKFAQMAAQVDRLDVANSTTAFVASLDRMARSDRLKPARLITDEEEELAEGEA